MMTKPWLAKAAERARLTPGFLGHVLSSYCEDKGYQNVADELSCTIETLRWLMLRKAPKPGSDDIQTIARYFGLSPDRLTALIQRAQEFTIQGL